jgi:hypothetical protein
MGPTILNLQVIQRLAPFQKMPLCVDIVDVLAKNPLANGLVYAVPLFLLWHSAGADQRALAQRMMLTSLIGTVIGALGSLLFQRRFRRLPPAANPALASAYAFCFREYFRVHPNPNCFPSDSAMLYSNVAFGVAAWNHGLCIGLLAWLFLFMMPAKTFMGGHYPTDIVAGVLLGFFSYQLAEHLMMTSRFLDALVSNQGLVLAVVLFAWLFEVGNEFRDVRHIADGAWHIGRRFDLASIAAKGDG